MMIRNFDKSEDSKILDEIHRIRNSHYEERKMLSNDEKTNVVRKNCRTEIERYGLEVVSNKTNHERLPDKKTI